MLDDQESEFILSIFLMEAWDTVASVEEGVRRLAGGDPPSAAIIDPLVVVAHRLKGASALHGYPVVSAVALVMESLLEKLPGQSPPEQGRTLEALEDVVATVRRVLDMIGDDGREDVVTVSRLRARYPELFPVHGEPELTSQALIGTEPSPASPPTSAEPLPPLPNKGEPQEIPEGPGAQLDQVAADVLLADLERFFAEHAESVPYFAPEAAEHLEVMTRSILALEEATGTAKAEEVARLFRAVHTLKGAAYTVGCAPVGDVAHRIEDILDAVRDQRLDFAPAVFEAVLGGVDTLRLLLGGSAQATPDARIGIQRSLDVLDALRPAPVPFDRDARQAEEEPALVPSAPAPVRPRFMPAMREPQRRREGEGREGRPSIRVGLDRLDSLMNLVGELVIARSRLDQRFAQIERVNELLAFSRSRMSQAVRDFEEKHRYTQLPPALSGAAADPGSDVFAELEFDRYDDFNIFARSVDEISADVSEIQAQLAGFIRSIGEDTAQLHRLTGRLRGEVTRARMVPIGRLFSRFLQPAREAARAGGKSVDLKLAGETVEVDNAVIEQIADPLLHLVRNAVDHGIESEEARRAAGKPSRATIGIRAHHQGSFVHIEVTDDGRGMDPARLRERAARLGFLSPAAAQALDAREALNLIFLPGFSTAPEVTTTSGRGVGMDVVRANVGRLNGEIDVQSELGAGTRITIKLPLTVIVSDALLVRAGGETFAVPMHAVRTVIQVRPEDILRSGDRERVVVEEEDVELVRLDRALALPEGRALARLPVLVVRSGVRPLAVAVEELVGKEDVVIKNLGGLLERVGPFAGATITGGGQVILLVDPSRLAEATETSPATKRAPALSRERGPARERAAPKTWRILLVDDSISVRKFVGQMLEKASFEVVTANDGAEALRRLGDTAVDLVITDLEMPRVSGYELIEDLRARPATRALPVVVLTTRAGAKHVSLARSLGIVHYVAKPVDEEAFVRLIVSLTGRGAAMAEVAR
ncbi:MAG TPA: hybrid sensor histidine kinase/response regulator [Methylomirabilota bacterium]|nr:hybrid sensor histidine kinase/response regulator [Methylomirabilota bacterium]